MTILVTGAAGFIGSNLVKKLCEISAGLSLGEYSALINSEAISFEEGIKLVQKRGKFMQELLPKGDWQMAAILGMTDEQVNEVCKKVSSGFVDVGHALLLHVSACDASQ